MFPPVLSKQDFVLRYAKGEFGNRSPTWESYSEFSKVRRETGLLHVRNRIPGGDTWYNVHPIELSSIWRRAVERYGAANLYISEMAPTKKTLIQGEVYRDENGLNFFHSTVAKPMRDALRERPREASGLEAQILLRYHMNVRSYEWLEVLLDRYPDHVIEISVYSVCWGTEPGYNTTFWEVRNY